MLMRAGTYTPIAQLGLGGNTGRKLLGRVWAGAAAGILQSFAWPHAPKAIATGIYIALGWVIVPHAGEGGTIFSVLQQKCVACCNLCFPTDEGMVSDWLCCCTGGCSIGRHGIHIGGAGRCGIHGWRHHICHALARPFAQGANQSSRSSL